MDWAKMNRYRASVRRLEFITDRLPYLVIGMAGGKGVAEVVREYGYNLQSFALMVVMSWVLFFIAFAFHWGVTRLVKYLVPN